MLITSRDHVKYMAETFYKVQPEVCAFDTETDGLHIIHNHPFIFAFAFDQYTFVYNSMTHPKLLRLFIRNMFNLAGRCTYLLGNNIKFDLHMLANIGYPYPYTNALDTMICIRLAHDALKPAEGGPPLGLKDYATRYIDRTANLYEKRIQSQRSAIAKQHNIELKQMLKPFKTPEGKSWGLGYLQEFFKDPTTQVTDLPSVQIQQVYMQWKENLPLETRTQMTTTILSGEDIPYTALDPHKLAEYAANDVVLTLQVFNKTYPVIQVREQLDILHLEQDLILPLYEMERVGFDVDVEYLLASEVRVREYIKYLKEELQDLVGFELSIGQHAVIKSLLFGYGLSVDSTNNESLNNLLSDLKRHDKKNAAIKFIQLIQELRTLYKWYSTYILRFINQSKIDGRLYTQINQVGTVSGRVTSDFQQFPKQAILARDGTELFHPRKIIKTPPNKRLLYLDYSQIELRVQAMYTILVGTPDLNLCRAYMPYKCRSKVTGEMFDYNNKEHHKRWNSGEWEHDGIDWEPLDVHGATTTAATGLKPGDEGFKKLRTDIGKRVNFAKNYGAQLNRIAQMFPDKDFEEIKRIDEAYYIAFPGVKGYHQYCYDIAQSLGYATNLFGLKYYNISGHKLINMLIQGSSAYLLKKKIIEIYKYNKENNIKTKFQMNVHDELSFIQDLSEPDIWKVYKDIMEDWKDSLVPIVADVEYSVTTWSNKEELNV